MGSALQNDPRLTGNGLRKGFEPPIGIDVIDDHRSPRPQGRPGAVQLEANVMFAVQAVMNKQVDLAKFGKNAGKAPLA
jgi:hypothetical protein